MASLEQELHRGRIPTVVFLDIKAAFDSVFHTAILESLAGIGFGGRLYAWVSSYLERRQLFMSTPEGPTSCHIIEKGVPQGAVLSPLLFNIVLINLKRALPPGVKLTIYADDIFIWSAARSRRHTQKRLQKALKNISDYLAPKGLRLSPEKA